LYLMPPRLPRSTLFPYTTLFRSLVVHARRLDLGSELRLVDRLRIGGANRQARSEGDVGVEGFHLGHGSIDRRRRWPGHHAQILRDRKSTRLNSSHVSISYAVFCL